MDSMATEPQNGSAMQTRNVDELVDAVSKVYCPFTIQVIGKARDIDAVFEITHSRSQPLVTLSHSAPVRIDAGNFDRLFLVMHCARGHFSARQENSRGEFFPGQTVPFSAGFDTRMQFDWEFLQKSVRLDSDKLETLCARWLGHPLDRRLRFAMRPFSDNLQRIWQNTLSYVWHMDSLPLSAAAKASFDEYLLTLLLHQHPHNFSEEMGTTGPSPLPAIIRRAERYMVDRASEPITTSDIAADLGVSLRSLQAGFRKWRATTPHAFLRRIRLQLVHDELQRSGGEVTRVALRYGFAHLGRFSAHYREAFGEDPSKTLRRSRNA